jgi:hypothetical protein
MSEMLRSDRFFIAIRDTITPAAQHGFKLERFH